MFHPDDNDALGSLLSPEGVLPHDKAGRSLVPPSLPFFGSSLTTSLAGVLLRQVKRAFTIRIESVDGTTGAVEANEHRCTIACMSHRPIMLFS